MNNDKKKEQSLSQNEREYVLRGELYKPGAYILNEILINTIFTLLKIHRSLD